MAIHRNGEKNMKSICRFSLQPTDSNCFSNIIIISV